MGSTLDSQCWQKMLTDDQKRVRRTAIGGSEIAAVAGLDPYATALDVWRSKVEGYEREQTPAMRRGQLLEPVIASIYAEESRVVLEESGTIRHPTRPVAVATPDRIALWPDGRRVLEIKSANSRMTREWGEPGTDEIPRAYLCQVLWELACAGLERADLAVLIAGDDFRIYHLYRDVELEGLLLEKAEKFWRDHVDTKTPPPIDGSDSCDAWLAARHPRSITSSVIESTPEAEELMWTLRGARHAIEAAEVIESDAKNKLKALVGDASGMIGGHGRWKISWKSQSRNSIDVDALISALGISPETVAKYTIQKSTRVFRPSWKDE